MTQQTKRTAQWGHWGITFCTHAIDEHGRQSYAPLQINAQYNFPVANGCGPQDNLPGQRELFRAMIRDWTEFGVLPQGLPVTRATA